MRSMFLVSVLCFYSILCLAVGAWGSAHPLDEPHQKEVYLYTLLHFNIFDHLPIEQADQLPQDIRTLWGHVFAESHLFQDKLLQRIKLFVTAHKTAEQHTLETTLSSTLLRPLKRIERLLDRLQKTYKSYPALTFPKQYLDTELVCSFLQQQTIDSWNEHFPNGRVTKEHLFRNASKMRSRTTQTKAPHIFCFTDAKVKSMEGNPQAQLDAAKADATYIESHLHEKATGSSARALHSKYRKRLVFLYGSILRLQRQIDNTPPASDSFIEEEASKMLQKLLVSVKEGAPNDLPAPTEQVDLKGDGPTDIPPSPPNEGYVSASSDTQAPPNVTSVHPIQPPPTPRPLTAEEEQAQLYEKLVDSWLNLDTPQPTPDTSLTSQPLSQAGRQFDQQTFVPPDLIVASDARSSAELRQLIKRKRQRPETPEECLLALAMEEHALTKFLKTYPQEDTDLDTIGLPSLMGTRLHFRRFNARVTMINALYAKLESQTAEKKLHKLLTEQRASALRD